MIASNAVNPMPSGEFCERVRCSRRVVAGALASGSAAAEDSPVFGVMVACGAGGTLTEILDDVALKRPPFDVAQAEALMQRLRIVQRASKIDPHARIAPAAEFVARFSELAASAPWRRFVLEINPIKWGSKFVTAVDGRY